MTNTRDDFHYIREALSRVRKEAQRTRRELRLLREEKERFASALRVAEQERDGAYTRRDKLREERDDYLGNLIDVRKELQDYRKAQALHAALALKRKTGEARSFADLPLSTKLISDLCGKLDTAHKRRDDVLGQLDEARKELDKARKISTHVADRHLRYRTASRRLLRQLSTLADDAPSLVVRLAILKLVDDTREAIAPFPKRDETEPTS